MEEEKKVNNFSGADHFYMGAHMLVWSLIFLITAGVICGVLKRLQLDGGVTIGICVTVASMLEAWALSVLARGDREVTDDPNREDEVDPKRIRYNCFYRSSIVQSVAVVVSIITLILVTRVEVKNTASVNAIGIIGKAAFCVLTLVVSYLECIGLAEYADRKSTKTARAFKVGSIIYPICKVALFISVDIYNPEIRHKAVPITFVCIGLVGTAVFVALLAIMARKYKEELTDHGRVCRRVVRAVLFIGLLLLGTGSMVGLKISFIKNERIKAEDHYYNKILKSDEYEKGYSDYWDFSKYPIAEISTMDEYHIYMDNPMGLPVFNVPIENIRLTGYTEKPENYNERLYKYRVFDNINLIKKYGYTTEYYIVTLEDNEKIVFSMPSYIYPMITKESTDGRVTLPIASGVMSVEINTDKTYYPDDFYTEEVMQEFKDILNIGKKDRELSKAEDLKFVLFNGYDSKFSDPVISDNYVIVEKRYALIANIMLVLWFVIILFVRKAFDISYSNGSGRFMMDRSDLPVGEKR